MLGIHCDDQAHTGSNAVFFHCGQHHQQEWSVFHPNLQGIEIIFPIWERPSEFEQISKFFCRYNSVLNTLIFTQYLGFCYKMAFSCTNITPRENKMTILCTILQNLCKMQVNPIIFCQFFRLSGSGAPMLPHFSKASIT